MTGRTHDLAAFMAITLVFIYSPSLPEMSLITVVLAMSANFIGGLFPDIDQKSSDFWDNFRMGSFISHFIVPILGGHRNISHSILGTSLFGWLAYKLLTYASTIILIKFDPQIIWISFMIGFISHILMDMPTKAGVPLLWPLKITFGIPPFRFMRITSGKFIEHWIIFPGLMIFTIYLIYTNQDRVLYFIHNNIK